MQVTITRSENPTVREVFDSAKPVMLNLSEKMVWGEATPQMFRSAMRRLSSMMEIAGRTGDFKSEAEILDLMSTLALTAISTIYH